MVVVIILVIIVCIILFVGGTSSSSKASSSSRTSTRQYSTSGAQSANGPTQSEYNLARQADQVANQQVRKSIEAINHANLMAMRDIEIAFVTQQETMAKQSERLEGQLQRLMAQRLQESSFQQYIQLHHASRDAADKRYDAYTMAKKSLDEIGRVIVGMGKGTIRASQQEKRYAYLLKDAIKACRDANLANVQLLNHQTHAFKLKIRDECGAGGRNWYQQVERKNGNSWG